VEDGLPAPAGANCLPVRQGDPQSVSGNFAYTSGNALVDENANELWSVLVSKPWLYCELGTTAYATTPGPAEDRGEPERPAAAVGACHRGQRDAEPALIQAKQSTYTGIPSSMQQASPACCPLF
jgi:hypothetical protein